MTGAIPRGVLLGVGIALIGGLVLLIWRGDGSRDPASLDVGDCFDVPAATDGIGDLRRRGCSEPHDAEVFHVYQASGAGLTGYPTDADWEAIVHPVCDPAFEGYTGTLVAERLDIDYRYLVPTAARWPAGDRRVTCFITALDGLPLSRSFRVP
jgi:hypothetical protein